MTHAPTAAATPRAAERAAAHAQAPAVASVGPGGGASEPDALLGTVIAERYRLIERIGEGGMGAVYRGEHVALRKRVAVKFLHKDLGGSKEYVARFEREALAAAHLEHPNIAAATDFGQLPDGTFFLVMEFVEGRSLRKLLRQEGGRLAPPRALHVLEQIGAALTRAHGLGVVHRDLKPENVIVCDGDVVKVIDFGIARVTSPGIASGGTALTQLGSVFGTPQYMAPEQAMGQRVDAAADQYALGVIAFELLAGRLPFVAEELVDLLHMHVGAPVPRLSSLVPDAPPALDAALARMLGKRPAERFASVAAALEGLAAAVRGGHPPADAAVPALGASAASPPHGAMVPGAGAAPAASPLPVPFAAASPAGGAAAAAPWVGANTVALPPPQPSRGPTAVPPVAIALGALAVLAVLLFGALTLRRALAPREPGAATTAAAVFPGAGGSAAARPSGASRSPEAIAQAREALHGATSCEELGASLRTLTALAGAGDEDVRRIQSGDCTALEHGEICAQCLVWREGDEREGRGRGNGRGRGHGRGHGEEGVIVY